MNAKKFTLVGGGVVLGHASTREQAEKKKEQLEKLLICSIAIKESADERVSARTT